MNPIAWIIHLFTGCPDKDLEDFRGKKLTCRKCGRVYFVFTK